jgi:integrase
VDARLTSLERERLVRTRVHFVRWVLDAYYADSWSDPAPHSACVSARAAGAGTAVEREPDMAQAPTGGHTLRHQFADALLRARQARDAAEASRAAAAVAHASAAETREDARRARALSKAVRRTVYTVT